MSRPATLVTIPFSHFCEKARWVLDRAGVAYVEEKHAPGFHRRATRALGAKGSVPVFVTEEGEVLDDSSLVLARFGRRAGLEPRDADGKRAMDELCARFDRELGPDLRRIAYHHLLARRADTIATFRRDVPRWEGALVAALFPLLRVLMRRGMRIDDAGAARSEARLLALLDAVSARLADGRAWLLGEQFTAADLTFASLAAPAIRPPAYAARLAVSEPPPELAPLLRRVVESPAGRLVQRAYEVERTRVISNQD